MLGILGTLLGKVMEGVFKMLPFLLAYRQGSKDQKAKNVEGELKRARKAKKIERRVRDTNIVTLRDRLSKRNDD